MRLEAVLLLAKSPLTTRKLAQLAYLADATEARTLVRQLNRTYETHGRALRVEQVAGGYRLMTRSALAPWLAKLGHLPEAVRLSTPMMETLAVVAYRQPVSRANVEAVRGVACGELLRQLMERDLIRIAGRSEELGRPYLYGTTKRFLQLFGLPNTDALPPIRWHALQDDPDQDNDGPQHTSLESTTDEMSSSPKESVVTTVLASVLAEADPEILSDATVSDEWVAESTSLAPIKRHARRLATTTRSGTTTTRSRMTRSRMTTISTRIWTTIGMTTTTTTTTKKTTSKSSMTKINGRKSTTTTTTTTMRMTRTTRTEKTRSTTKTTKTMTGTMKKTTRSGKRTTMKSGTDRI